MSAAMNELKNYVTAQDHLAYTRLPQGTVSVTVTHQHLMASLIELKFDLHQTIGDVKARIHLHCGTNPSAQQLILKSGGQMIRRLDNDDKMLGFYGVESGMELHVLDSDPFSLARGGGLEDVSLIQKYRMSEEDYDKRQGTLRSWIKEQKAKDPNWEPAWNKKEGGDADVEKEPMEPPGPETVAGFKVGDRCEVQPGGRRGNVMFLGEVEGMAAGYWVGVKFDEPVGRSNGMVKGVCVFEAGGEKMGGFIRPHNVQVGDFPERDLEDELDSEDEI